MKRKLYFLFLLYFVSAQSQTQFSYFPLTQGNKWFFAFDPYNDYNINSIWTILEVVGDTLMPDGNNYARIDRHEKRGGIYRDSIWTESVGVYFFREENNILYNYPGDTLLNYCWNDSTHWSQLPEGFMELHIANDSLFGESRLTYYLYVYNPYQYISYTDSIGFNALYALEWRDWLEESRYLVGCIIDGKTFGDVVTSVNSQTDQNQNTYKLFQNYPNPFNSLTTIKYTIPVNNNVSLKVYDILGKEIMTLVNEYKKSGYYGVVFDAHSLSSGVYFYKLISGHYIDTKKLMLLK